MKSSPRAGVAEKQFLILRIAMKTIIIGEKPPTPKAFARNEFSALTWQQLLSHSVRNWKINVNRFKMFEPIRDSIVSGPFTANWFESLMTAAFATPAPDQPEAFETITREYIRLLRGLQEFLETCWPREWKNPTPAAIRACHGYADADAEDSSMLSLSLSDSPQVDAEALSGYNWMAPRRQAHHVQVFSTTCRWLESIAAVQAQHACPPTFPIWNAELFEFTEVAKSVGMFAGVGDYEITTPILNPRTLAQEIERLSQGVNDPLPPAKEEGS